MEEAGAMKEEARRPGRSSVAADKLYMESRQRAAADGQPRNAGLYASQQYDSGISSRGAAEQHAIPVFDPKGLLPRMDREAARLDKAGRHADVKRVRIAARGRKGEANPLPIEAFLPALNSGTVQPPMSYIDALALLQGEAARLDKEGRHDEAERMRAVARGMQQEANPLQTGAVLPAQDFGAWLRTSLAADKLTNGIGRRAAADVQLLNTRRHAAQPYASRIDSIEALEEKALSDINEAKVLERGAEQHAEQGKPLQAQMKRTRARYMRQEAQMLQEEAALLGQDSGAGLRTSLAADKLNTKTKQRAATDVQALDAGLRAPQLYASRKTSGEAVEQHAVSTTAPMGLLEVLDVLDREADSLNQGGRHHEAEALWAAFRLLAKQAKPLRPEAGLPAKHSGKMLFFHSPSAVQHPLSYIDALGLLEEEAARLDKEGRHIKAKLMRAEARGMQEENPLHTGAVRPPQNSGAFCYSQFAPQRDDGSYDQFIRLLQKEAQRKAAPVSMGRLDTRQWLEMQRAAPLRIAVAEALPVTAAPAVPDYVWVDSDYVWVDSDERDPYERHIEHLRKVIRLSSGETKWVNAGKDYPGLLSCHTLGYNISATTDVLALDISAIRAGLPQTGIRLLMDIRQAIAACDVNRAQARLLLGNLHSPESRPALVLTDLINEWHAMWLDGSTIYQHTFTSQNRAVGFIDDLLAGRFETCRDISQTSFAKRRQMDDRLCVSCARNALFAQQVQALSTHSIGLVSRGSFETSGRCTVPMTDREMLSSIEEQKKSADIVMQKAQALRGGASTICGHPYLAAFMLEDAKRLQAQADDERLRALCLEKLIHGDAPSVEEARVGLFNSRHLLQWLSQSRDFVSMNHIDATMWTEALRAAELKESPIVDPHMDSVPGVPEPEFAWDDRDYSAQWDRYIPHLKGIIKLGEDSEWVDAAHNYPELLSYYGVRALGYNIEATTDVLVAKRSAVRAHLPVKGARVLFALRKQVADSDLVHAQVRTVLANLHAEAEKPVVVVTDLRSEWHFTWMDDSDIFQCHFPTRGQAVTVINDILAGSINAGQGGTRSTIAQRREITEQLFATVE
ncbi:g10987 [Coccomyxa viridis]|uniref:G10987 protein n=1 Tax=Coccomyxa viridis TaxID=1274662 RepID=A0ABP1G9H0_9CHLO